MRETNEHKSQPAVRPRAVRAGILLALVAASATGGCETMREVYERMDQDERDRAFLEWQAQQAQSLNSGSGSGGAPAQNSPPDPQNPQHPPL